MLREPLFGLCGRERVADWVSSRLEGMEMPQESHNDPWRHRSSGMRCWTCMWWVRKKNDIGRCRRHAPTMGGYPVVYDVDWCGDHKLDEKRASGKLMAPLGPSSSTPMNAE